MTADVWPQFVTKTLSRSSGCAHISMKEVTSLTTARERPGWRSSQRETQSIVIFTTVNLLKYSEKKKNATYFNSDTLVFISI